MPLFFGRRKTQKAIRAFENDKIKQARKHTSEQELREYVREEQQKASIGADRRATREERKRLRETVRHNNARAEREYARDRVSEDIANRAKTRIKYHCPACDEYWYGPPISGYDDTSGVPELAHPKHRR